MSPSDGPIDSVPATPGAGHALWLMAGFASLVITITAFVMLYPRALPPPGDVVAADPLLRQGHELYHTRCVSCHGVTGRGDGPIAKMAGPTRVGDLTDKQWKHGERPDEVLNVIARGVRDTSMSGWSGTFNEAELRALAAFVFHLGGRSIPREYRVDDK